MNIEKAEMVLPCIELDTTLNFFIERLRFRVDSIFPADNPRVAVVSGYGMRIRLELSETENNENVRTRLNCALPKNAETLVAPNGVSIEFADSDTPLVIPDLEPSLVINKLSENADWIEGRAGMRYRDLIPERLGGYVTASHIHIPEAGPVPDYVHFHKVQFQMIYCYKGWVKVVYEDQGEPFVLNAGDCVLQPPEIRHRVLECSENLEVIELSLPAEHITYADHDLTLPNGRIDSERTFNGQKFVRHVAKNAVWQLRRIDGFECCDTGIHEATKELANAKVVRVCGELSKQIFQHDSAFLFIFVLKGTLAVKLGGTLLERIGAGDSFVLPKNIGCKFLDCSNDLELLEVYI